MFYAYANKQLYLHINYVSDIGNIRLLGTAAKGDALQAMEASQYAVPCAIT